MKYEIDRRYPFEATADSVCPVPDETILTLWFSDGVIMDYQRAGDYYWNHQNDLYFTHFMVTEYPPEKNTAWVNVYPNIDFPQTKELADEQNEQRLIERLACIKIEWVDGEGL